MNYESMTLHLYHNVESFKINIVNGTVYFPTGCFVQSHFPLTPVIMFLTILDHLPIQTMPLSFVQSVVSLWNSLPDHVKFSPLSVFKAHVSH